MMELKSAFRALFNKDLEKEVGSDVSGYFKRFLVSLIAVILVFNAKIIGLYFLFVIRMKVRPQPRSC